MFLRARQTPDFVSLFQRSPHALKSDELYFGFASLLPFQFHSVQFIQLLTMINHVTALTAVFPDGVGRHPIGMSSAIAGLALVQIVSPYPDLPCECSEHLRCPFI